MFIENGDVNIYIECVVGEVKADVSLLYMRTLIH